MSTTAEKTEPDEVAARLDDEAAPNFCLMMLVGMSDPGLIILPTHRLVSGLQTAPSAPQLEAALAGHFDIVERFGSNAQAAWEHVQMDGAQTAFAFGTVAVLYLLLLLWGPTAQTHRWPFVITAAVLLALGVELLRRQTLREHPEARGADLSESARALFGRTRAGPSRTGPPPTGT